MKKTESDVPRPPCGCGAPATAAIQLQVRRLDLERDPGAHTRAYWAPSYKKTTHSIESLVCDGCLASSVRVAVVVDASVSNSEKK